MGKVRAFSKHAKWTPTEVDILLSKYIDSEWHDLLKWLPGRSQSKIQNKAYLLGLLRKKATPMTEEERRRAKADSMALARSKDPCSARKYAREFYHKNKRQQQAYQKMTRDRRFFWNRANRLKGKGKANFRELAALWKKQKGLCALSGRHLTRANVEIDHIIPKVKGGKDCIENLQWVTREANRAKRDLTELEFLELCYDCMEWIGRRIQHVENLNQ